MKRKWLILGAIFIGYGAFAQTIVKEATFDPEGKANISNLTEVQVDKEKNEMKLFFLTKSTEKKMKAEILYFDLDLNFLRNENIEEEFEKIKVKYKFRLSLDLCPESKEPLLVVEPNFSGQTVFKKGYIERFYNWNTGFCDDHFKVEERVKPKGDDGEKIKLVAYWSDNEIENYFRRTSFVKYSYWKGTTYVSYQINKARQVMKGDAGDVVFLGLISDGIKDPNLGKRYTFQKFSVAKLEKVNEIPLNFDVTAVPIFKKFLSNGNICFVFHREDNKIEFLEVNFDGETQKRFVKDAPTKGIWIIDDIVETEKGDLLVSGVISTREFPKWARGYLMYPQNIIRDLQVWAWKPSGFQVMKVTNDIDFISFTSVKEFPTKLLDIEGEKKKGKPYKGGPLVVGDAFLTKSNEVVVTAQKKDKKGRMSDICAFYFDSQGKLIAHYSTPMRDKNDYNQTTPTRQSLMNSPSTNDVYWTIFEVAGAKKRGATARILYSPRIARIQDSGKKVSAFLDFLPKKFYLDDKFPVNYIDGKDYIFLGSNKAGKVLMFYKLSFE